MKTVHIAYGGTYPHKNELRKWKFNWHPGDKVWVKFWESTQEQVDETTDFVEGLRGVQYDTTMADPYIGTCVDPVNRTTKGDGPTGYKIPKVDPADIPRKHFDYSDGDQIEIDKWIAGKLQEALDMDVFFRNLHLTEVVNETRKAVYAKVEFLSNVAQSCHLCGRGLDDPISKACGIGPVCIKKLGIKRLNKKTSQQVLKEIEEICKDIGEIGPVWIAKSRIKQKLNTVKADEYLAEILNKQDGKTDLDRAAEAGEPEAVRRLQEKIDFSKWEQEQEEKAYMAKKY